jgi:acetyl-CoA carboxylase biotin carboxyl carrier protein
MNDPGDREELLSALGGELRRLARELPGSLHRVVLEASGNRIEVEWAAEALSGTVSSGTVSSGTVQPDSADAVEQPGLEMVRAPLVGTYFEAPEPGAAPYAVPEDIVEEGQTLAIVEAMKMMNPITAEFRARVVEMLVSNGDAVEFEQPLMLLEPLDGRQP